MAKSLFRLAPDEARREGAKQINHSGEFKNKVAELYKTVDMLLQTGYTSPAARDLHAKIYAKRTFLDGVTKTLYNYGSYLITSGNETVAADESVADGSKI